MEFLIGCAGFICGFLMMFAIHRVIFDHYASKAMAVIRELKRHRHDNIEVTYVHEYAKPGDVSDLKFNE